MTAGKALSSKDMGGNKINNLGAPGTTTDAARQADVDTAREFARSRANHTGTQLASSVSDFDTQVRTSRLDQMAVPTSDLNLNSRKITNQADPTVAQDSATKAYVDAQVAGLVTGQTLKGSVRAATSTNVTISAPGATIDGVTAVTGDVFLLAAQTTATENGPYIFNGSGTAMTRAANWDSSAEAVLGSYWIVREGSKADSMALLSTDTTVTLGTTSLSFVFISVAGAAIQRFAATCPAVTAGGTWTINHAMNSTDLHVMVKRVASPFDYVEVYTETTDANTVSIKPDSSLAAGEYRAIIKY